MLRLSFTRSNTNDESRITANDRKGGRQHCGPILNLSTVINNGFGIHFTPGMKYVLSNIRNVTINSTSYDY